MSYENSPATKMMATHCIICGRALVDAVSVERGVGPECYHHVQGNYVEVDPETHKKANEYVYKASLACQTGSISKVLEYAELIRGLGMNVLADKVAKRFRNASRNAEIVITVEGNELRVDTPFRRGAKDAFIAAWRAIPGRQFRNGSNYIPLTQKKALYGLLKDYFGGKFATGPKGVFRIPVPDPKMVQGGLFSKVA